MKLAGLALAAVLFAAGAAHAQNAQALLKRSGCRGCHAMHTNLNAPALATIAAKYRGNADAVAILTDVVKNGAHGGGPLSMPPHPNVSDADAEKMVKYILSLKQR